MLMSRLNTSLEIIGDDKADFEKKGRGKSNPAWFENQAQEWEVVFKLYCFLFELQLYFCVLLYMRESSLGWHVTENNALSTIVCMSLDITTLWFLNNI